MSNVVRGVVERTFNRDFGNKTYHSFTVKGKDGFFGTGERSAVEAGKAYEFEYTQNGKYLNVNLSTLRPWEGGEAMQSTPAASFRRGGGGFKGDPAKDEYWKNKEARDLHNDKLRELGATRNTAIALVSMMLQNGAVKLPAKESAKSEVIYALVEHYVEVLMEGKKEEAKPASEALEADTGEDSEWK